MSYILEALRKSERQRQARLASSHPSLLDPDGQRRQPWIPWLVALLLAINAGTLAYLWLKSGGNNPPSVPPASPPPAMPVANVEPGPPAQSSRPAPIAQTETQPKPQLPIPVRPEPSATAVRNAGNPPSTPPARPEPVKPSVARTPPPSVPVSHPDVPSKDTEKVAPPSPAWAPLPERSEPHPDDDAAIPLLDSLPSSFRERIPPFRINIHAYSSSPADRFVIIDMKKYRVGDKIPGGAELVDIRAESMVLRLDTVKFRISRP